MQRIKTADKQKNADDKSVVINNNADDNKIIELFYARSEHAIAQLSAKYGSACIKIAKNILKSELDAQECVNDAFLAAWNTIPPQNPNPLSTYIYRIVRNISIAKYHSNTAAKRNSYYDISLDELENCLSGNSLGGSGLSGNILAGSRLAGSGLSGAAGLDDEATAKELSALIDKFLATLDQKSRVMFVRRYWYADSLSDISARFQISENNVAVRLSRIRKKLKKFLKEEGYTI